MGEVKERAMVPVDELVPYAKNARIHEQSQVDLIARSIQEFGFLNPVLIDRDKNVIAGHGRIMAAKQLGMEAVPVLYIDGLTEQQRQAYVLADNRLTELGGWNMQLVNVELEELSGMDFDVSLTGFDFELEGGAEVSLKDDDFDPDEAAPPVAKRGDIFQLGEHRLMCGDTSSADDMEKLMDGEFADMVFTDPPYGVSIGTKNKKLNEVIGGGGIQDDIEGDTLDEAELYDLLLGCFINIRESCKNDACYYVTSPHGGSLGLMMMMMMRDAGLAVRHVLIWEKNSATFSIGQLDYEYKHEAIFYTWTKSHHNYRAGENRTTVWNYDRPRKSDLHPTMKPVELVANAILDGTKAGDVVLDGFGGSGTTIIACEQTGRRARLMEIDPHYADVIIKRWEDHTGRKAEKLNV